MELQAAIVTAATAFNLPFLELQHTTLAAAAVLMDLMEIQLTPTAVKAAVDLVQTMRKRPPEQLTGEAAAVDLHQLVVARTMATPVDLV
jgi:hypothetical protein